MDMTRSRSLKTFLLGLSVSILVLFSFFAGALADRVFEVKPIDYFTDRLNLPSSRGNPRVSELGTLIAQNSSVADVAEIASKSVVTVSLRRQERIFDEFSPFSPGFGIFGIPRGQVEEVQRDIGTGFVVEDGLIVTNKHVVSEPNAEYFVIDKDNNQYEITEIYRDPANDLAIVKAQDFSVEPLPLGDSEQLRVGQAVIAIGTALGEFRHTVTTGVVSGLGRGIEAVNPQARTAEDLEGLIQTDAAINPGNSGGPLLDRSGQVVGVNVAISAGAENIGFALPINLVKNSLGNFQETGSFERPFFGVSYRMITKQAALLNEVPQGAYVLDVIDGSTAEQVGLEIGDIITHFDGQKLNEDDLATLLNKKSIGDKVSLKYWRDGKSQEISLTLRGRDN